MSCQVSSTYVLIDSNAMNPDEAAARIEILEARLARVVDALIVLLESIQAGDYDVAAAEILEMLRDDA